MTTATSTTTSTHLRASPIPVTSRSTGGTRTCSGPPDPLADRGTRIRSGPPDPPWLERVADQRAGHAVPAAAALAQLEAIDGDDLDAGLAYLGDRVGVALVGDHHAVLERDDVVAVVPLLAFLLVGVAAGLDHPELGHPQGVGHRGQEALLLGDVEAPLGGAG